jgi:hypothetical protein
MDVGPRWVPIPMSGTMHWECIQKITWQGGDLGEDESLRIPVGDTVCARSISECTGTGQPSWIERIKL